MYLESSVHSRPQKIATKYRENLRHFSHRHPFLTQHIRRIPGSVHEVLEVVLQGFFVGGLVDVLEDVEDDARIAVGVEEDFLIVGDLADGAGAWGQLGCTKMEEV